MLNGKLTFSSFLSRTDVSGLSQRWNKLRRRCASFKAVSGPTSLDSDASYILTEPVTQYAVLPPNEQQHRHQRAASVTPTVDGSSKPIRPFSWRKSHSVEKYEYRDVNLNSSIPEKINKSIPLPDDYWKIHEQDVKLWKIGCASPNRPISMRDIPKDVSDDWEFNVRKFETLNGSSLERRNRIQYYTGDSDTNQRKQQNGTDGSSERKEIKFPSLKAFKSASMRLPGQKSSLQEVHQMLRNKFNRLNVGLRKKRTLSVQEVFQQSPTSQSPKGQPPSQFYVPSPMPATKIYTTAAVDDTTSNRSGSDVTSLPYYATNSPNSKSSSALNNQANSIRSNSSAVNASSPSKNGNAKQMSRSSSNNNTNNRTKVTDEKKALAAKDGATTTPSSTPKQQHSVGGRISLREKMPHKSTATKISNAVRERIRRRPRSHSPVKPTIESTSSLSKATAAAATVTANGGRKNRDSFGLFGRINRIMSVNHLPPPHSNSSNNNNSTNNNMNRSKANGSHDLSSTTSSSTTAATTAAAATPKKIQNDETKSVAAIKSPINQSSIENGATRSPTKKQPAQTPDTNFLRDRKITNKQVRKE